MRCDFLNLLMSHLYNLKLRLSSEFLGQIEEFPLFSLLLATMGKYCMVIMFLALGYSSAGFNLLIATQEPISIGEYCTLDIITTSIIDKIL